MPTAVARDAKAAGLPGPVLDLGLVFDVAAVYANGRCAARFGRFPEPGRTAFIQTAGRLRCVLPTGWLGTAGNRLDVLVYSAGRPGGLPGTPTLLLPEPEPAGKQWGAAPRPAGGTSSPQASLHGDADRAAPVGAPRPASQGAAAAALTTPQQTEDRPSGQASTTVSGSASGTPPRRAAAPASGSAQPQAVTIPTSDEGWARQSESPSDPARTGGDCGVRKDEEGPTALPGGVSGQSPDKASAQSRLERAELLAVAGDASGALREAREAGWTATTEDTRAQAASEQVYLQLIEAGRVAEASPVASLAPSVRTEADRQNRALAEFAELVRDHWTATVSQEAMQAVAGVLRAAETSPAGLATVQATLPYVGTTVTYLGADRTTRGDWELYYGTEFHVLAAMAQVADWSGGPLPVAYRLGIPGDRDLPRCWLSPGSRESTDPRALLVGSRWKRVVAADPRTLWLAEANRGVAPDPTGGPLAPRTSLTASGSARPQAVATPTPDKGWVREGPLALPGAGSGAEPPSGTLRALQPVLPGQAVRRAAWWDDHGEAHAFDDLGPDLTVDLTVPAGEHVLSLYLVDPDWRQTWHPRQHSVLVVDTERNVLNLAWTGRTGDGVYERFAVRGPQALTVRVLKHRSACVALAGIFLDPRTPCGADVQWGSAPLAEPVAGLGSGQARPAGGPSARPPGSQSLPEYGQGRSGTRSASRASHSSAADRAGTDVAARSASQGRSAAAQGAPPQMEPDAQAQAQPLPPLRAEAGSRSGRPASGSPRPQAVTIPTPVGRWAREGSTIPPGGGAGAAPPRGNRQQAVRAACVRGQARWEWGPAETALVGYLNGERDGVQVAALGQWLVRSGMPAKWAYLAYGRFLDLAPTLAGPDLRSALEAVLAEATGHRLWPLRAWALQLWQARGFGDTPLTRTVTDLLTDIRKTTTPPPPAAAAKPKGPA